MLLKRQLLPRRSGGAEHTFQSVQLAKQVAYSRAMTLVLPARKGLKNLAFAFKRLKAILKSSQGLLGGLLFPSTAPGWLGWTCAAFHPRLPALRSIANPSTRDDATLGMTITPASFLSYSV